MTLDFYGLMSHQYPGELCKYGFDSSGKGSILPLKQTNKTLDLTDFVRKLFPRMPNNIWQNRSDELALQCYVPCQDCGALRVIKLSHTFHFNFLSHITTFCWKFCQQQGFFSKTSAIQVFLSLVSYVYWLGSCLEFVIWYRSTSHLYGTFLERKKLS